MLLPVETVMPIWIIITIHLIVSFAIHTFEDMGIWLPFQSSQVICFLIFHATPHFLPVMFSNMSSIILSASRDMRVALFPTVLTLRNARVYVHTMDSSYILSNVELAIDNVLYCKTTPGIPDVNPNHCHV